MLKQVLVSSILCILSSFAIAVEPKALVDTDAKLVEDTAVQEALATVEQSNKPKLETAKAESEIPLTIGATKKAGDQDYPPFRMLFSVSILGLLGTGAFFLLKRKSIPGQKKHQTQIKVLQQHYLGPKKSLAIIRVAGESILIGVTDSNISHIKTLSMIDDELPVEVPNSFSSVINGMDHQANFVESNANFSQNENSEASSDEEFSFGGIRNAVSKKLRNMRNFE